MSVKKLIALVAMASGVSLQQDGHEAKGVGLAITIALTLHFCSSLEEPSRVLRGYYDSSMQSYAFSRC